MESVRSAALGDLDRLCELWLEAEAEIGVQRGGILLVGSLARPEHLSDLIDQPDGLLALGCLDEVVVGFVRARLDRSPLRPVAVVDVAFVEIGARAVGVGEAMMEAVSVWARRLGCVGVDAFALPGNRTAKAFFETNGFVTRLLTMHRSLQPADGPVG